MPLVATTLPLTLVMCSPNAGMRLFWGSSPTCWLSPALDEHCASNTTPSFCFQVPSAWRRCNWYDRKHWIAFLKRPTCSSRLNDNRPTVWRASKVPAKPSNSVTLCGIALAHGRSNETLHIVTLSPVTLSVCPKKSMHMQHGKHTPKKGTWLWNTQAPHSSQWLQPKVSLHIWTLHLYTDRAASSLS